MLYEKISGFSDEIDPNFDKQIEGLKENGMKYLEIRGVDGKNVSLLTMNEMNAAKAKLDRAGLKVSSIGSPVGKTKIDGDFEEDLKVAENILLAAEIFETRYIRMFSFYIPRETREDGSYKKYRGEVLARLEKLFDMADKRGFVLCHENESDLYGESPEDCADIAAYFGGGIKLVFDPANFVGHGYETYPYAYNLMKDHIEYFHIKDIKKGAGTVPAGSGDGMVKEILTDAIRCGFNNFLSVEPHLKVFAGLDNLSRNGSPNIKDGYASHAEAFRAAKSALDDILAAI